MKTQGRSARREMESKYLVAHWTLHLLL
jgi:hypothetical protein